MRSVSFKILTNIAFSRLQEAVFSFVKNKVGNKCNSKIQHFSLYPAIVIYSNTKKIKGYQERKPYFKIIF